MSLPRKESRNTWVDPVEVKVESTPKTPESPTPVAYSKLRYLRITAGALLIVGALVGAFFGGAEYQKAARSHAFDNDAKEKVGNEVATSLNTKRPTPDISKAVTTAEEQTREHISVVAHKAGTTNYMDIKLYDDENKALATLELEVAKVSEYGIDDGTEAKLYRLTDEKSKRSLAFTWLFDKDGNHALMTFKKKGNKWIKNSEVTFGKVVDNRMVLDYGQTDTDDDSLSIIKAYGILGSMKLPLKRLHGDKDRRLSLGGTILNCLGTAAAAVGTVLACGPGEVIPVAGQATCGLAAAGTLSTGANCYDGIFD
jgi:hypothetical protein